MCTQFILQIQDSNWVIKVKIDKYMCSFPYATSIPEVSHALCTLALIHLISEAQEDLDNSSG